MRPCITDIYKHQTLQVCFSQQWGQRPSSVLLQQLQNASESGCPQAPSLTELVEVPGQQRISKMILESEAVKEKIETLLPPERGKMHNGWPTAKAGGPQELKLTKYLKIKTPELFLTTCNWFSPFAPHFCALIHNFSILWLEDLPGSFLTRPHDIETTKWDPANILLQYCAHNRSIIPR